MDRKKAEMIWEQFVSHPSMLMMPKKGELLVPSKRQVNFLGSAKAYKEKFLKSMEELKL